MYVRGKYIDVFIVVLMLPCQLLSVQQMVRHVLQSDTFENDGFKNITASSAVQCSVTCKFDSSCSSVSYHGHDRICQLNTNHVTITVSGWVTFEVKCAKNWIQSGGNCFLLVTTREIWSEAEVICHSFNGHLADINSLIENQDLTDGISESNETKDFWIGLHDPASNDKLVYPSGASVNYQNYGTRSYYNSHGIREDCFVIGSDGVWNDNNCLLKRPSVCKQNLN